MVASGGVRLLLDPRALRGHGLRMKKTGEDILVVIGFITAIVVTGMWVGGAFSKGEDEAAGQNDARFGLNARGSCWAYIKRNLNDPGSGEWVKPTQWPIFENQSGTYSVAATFRASNAYGALITSSETCRVERKDDDDAKVIGLE